MLCCPKICLCWTCRISNYKDTHRESTILLQCRCRCDTSDPDWKRKKQQWKETKWGRGGGSLGSAAGTCHVIHWFTLDKIPALLLTKSIINKFGKSKKSLSSPDNLTSSLFSFLLIYSFIFLRTDLILCSYRDYWLWFLDNVSPFSFVSLFKMSSIFSWVNWRWACCCKCFCAFTVGSVGFFTNHFGNNSSNDTC